MELKGVEGGDRKRGVGGETRRQKSLRIGVHHASAVVWEPLYRTRLMRCQNYARRLFATIPAKWPADSNSSGTGISAHG